MEWEVIRIHDVKAVEVSVMLEKKTVNGEYFKTQTITIRRMGETPLKPPVVIELYWDDKVEDIYLG